MKKQILKLFCALLFFVVFWYLFGDEYWEYREEWEKQEMYTQSIWEEMSDFNFEEIQNFGEDINLYYTPYLGLLDQLVSEIDAAQDKVYVEVYIFTETNLRDALIRAHKRWIEVKILLENNPYKAPYLNDKHYTAFKDAGVDVRWSDPLDYSLNHSKLLIIDDLAYVSTGNFSYSLFKYNRDFLVSINNQNLVDDLEQLFMNDFTHKNLWVYNDNLVLSPEYSRDKLVRLIQSSQKSIDFYFPYIADDEFKQIMFDTSKRGVNIRWIVEENFYSGDYDVIEEFEQHDIDLHTFKKDKIHGKAILVDDIYLYIWSINFSSYSFDENREIGLIISDSHIIEKFKNIFESDF